MVTPAIAVVRRPGPRLADGLVTHIERTPIDLNLAFRQWEGYVEVFSDRGWTIVEAPPVDDCADAVFIEDTAVVFGRHAVLCRLGAPEREPETTHVDGTLTGLGLDVVHLGDGTLDGGDVLKVGATVYVGRGGRTNTAGIAALRSLAEPWGYSVVAVPTTRVLHLKSAVTALPDGTIVGYPPDVDDPHAFPAFLGVPEPDGSHVVVLDDDTVLMASSAPRTAEIFRERGLDVVTVDISEFIRLEGCVTCLSVRVRNTGAQ